MHYSSITIRHAPYTERALQRPAVHGKRSAAESVVVARNERQTIVYKCGRSRQIFRDKTTSAFLVPTAPNGLKRSARGPDRPRVDRGRHSRGRGRHPVNGRRDAGARGHRLGGREKTELVRPGRVEDPVEEPGKTVAESGSGRRLSRHVTGTSRTRTTHTRPRKILPSFDTVAAVTRDKSPRDVILRRVDVFKRLGINDNVTLASVPTAVVIVVVRFFF